MKKIEKISKDIEHLIDLAENYAKYALYEKDNDINLAKIYNSASFSIIDVMKLFHNGIVNIIEEYKKEQGEPPADMLAIYNYLHGRQIEKVGEIKVIQNMFKE